jgi:hypothetical protein
MALERLAAGVLGMYLVGGGVLAVERGKWLYADYLGLPVPAPAAILVGALLVTLAVGRLGSRGRRRSRHL